MKKIAVIGAGISGLTCAYNLKQAGFDVTVFEKENQVGGRMRTHIKDGYHFDIGANHLVPLYTHMRKYIEAFGLEWYAFNDFGYGIFKKGEVMKPFDAISKMTKLKLFSSGVFSGRQTNFDQFLHPSEISEFDSEDGYTYLKNKIGEEATDYLGDGFVSAYQFYGLKEVSKAIVLAGIESIQHERKEWDLHLTRGGMSALPDAFAKELNVKLEYPVSTINTSDNGVDIDGERFDAAVLATTASVSRTMLKNPSPAQQELLTSVSYASSMVVAYKIPVSVCPKNTLVWTPKKDSPVIASYSLEHTKGSDVTQGDTTLLLVFLHDDAARELMDKSDEQIFEEVQKAFSQVSPWLEDISVLEPHNLQRWPEAMPTYPHGSIEKVKTFEENHQGEGNIWLCGDYLNAPWTEGALRCGERVAEDVIKKLA